MQGCFMLLLLLVFVCGATGRYAGQDRAMLEADHGSNSDQEDLEIAELCMDCFQESTDDDDTMDESDDEIACIIDCMIQQEGSKRALADVGTRKWRPGKKLGALSRKDRKKILKGIKTAGTIMVALAGK